MGLNMAAGLGGMLKDGHKHIEGVDMAIGKNIDACKQLSAITRTSMGPNGKSQHFKLQTTVSWLIATVSCRHEQARDQPLGQDPRHQ
jgi:hypothetical protein